MEPYGEMNPVVRLYINKKNLVFQPFERGVGFIHEYNILSLRENLRLFDAW